MGFGGGTEAELSRVGMSAIVMDGGADTQSNVKSALPSIPAEVTIHMPRIEQG